MQKRAFSILGNQSESSRRDFLQRTGQLGLAALVLPARALAHEAGYDNALSGMRSQAADSKADLPLVRSKVNWPDFLARHDLVWKNLPEDWAEAPFVGNGQIGAMVFAPDKDMGPGLRWHIGRTDVMIQGLWGGPQRVPIGDLILRTVGKIESCEMRQDLWNAEVTGTLKTDKGRIVFSTFTHTDQMVQVIELQPNEGEKDCAFAWVSPDFQTCSFWAGTLYLKGKGPKCPPPSVIKEGNLELLVQSLNESGEFSVVWSLVSRPNGRRVLYLDVGFSRKSGTARQEATEAVKKAAATGLESLRATHRKWWHQYYPASFVSIPDTRMESFYWIQMYRLASSTRAERLPMDNIGGPWWPLGDMPWKHIHWDLNIQLEYWPLMGANRLDLGESFYRMLDNNVDNLIRNAGTPSASGEIGPISVDNFIGNPPSARRESGTYSADSAGIGVETGLDCVSGGVEDYRFWPFWLGTLPFALHDYWLQYRHSMDDQRLREKLFPLLRRSINLYVHHLQTSDDGKLHITNGISPEYDFDYHTDCNFDLGLLRWGCRALLDICGRLKIDDPLIPRWREILEKLAPYPTNENGLMVAANLPLARSHRHYSHLFPFYPLYLLNPEQKENVGLLNKSVDHFAKLFKGGDDCTYSNTGTASMCAALGRADDALGWINRFVNITSNGMEREHGNPVSEGSLSTVQSLHDMLFTSWGGKIRVFPAVPNSWKDVVIHNVRTEGAFLLSAVRWDGKTQWVRVQSLAGEPCRIQPSLIGEVKAASKNVWVKALADGVYELGLAKGDEVLLYSGDKAPEVVVSPVAADASKCNSWGGKTPTN